MPADDRNRPMTAGTCV